MVSRFSEVTEEPDLRFQANAAQCIHSLLYMADQRRDIGCCRTVMVDNKAGMFFTDLCSSDPAALQPRILDQLAGKMPLGTFERRTG